ncbi:FMN-binding negative transcriptional regulator [Lacimicrobium alkaliphilum]|uniref:Transcriptional regulator n=1 Tax=Lacimicrobium alkaliphilum TaxID=1526571 RepID=A0A0U2ZGI9_9ALTE|nr:FMN-binding negative transcriptional regulator [Lacimicrobium alkaliphilum]ALS98119.1 transcriptional regulator [Lacimicrobium alkaliphilum]
MYIPDNMQMAEPSAIADFIAGHGFGIVISDNLNASHLPLVFTSDEGDKGCLYGHMAKANPHHKELQGQRVLVIFNGPHAYISPSWYARAPAVPTWNYAAVHCYGKIELISDDENHSAMEELVRKYEPSLLDTPEIMPADYQQRLRQAVVGFKVVVDEIQAKEKLGQHRKQEDQQGVYAALQNSPSADARLLAAYMRERGSGTGQ